MNPREPLLANTAADVFLPLWQGSQAIDGLWFPQDWLNADTTKRRILTNWRPGSQLNVFPSGYLLRFAAPHEIDCDQATGWPLRRLGNTLSSAPLTETERARLTAADVWIVAGGRVIALQLGGSTVVDPSDWLGSDAYVLHDSYDCRVALQPAFSVLIDDTRDVRSILGDIPPPSASQLAFLQELARSTPSAKARAPSMPSAGRKGQEGAWPSGRNLLLLVCIPLAVYIGWSLFHTDTGSDDQGISYGSIVRIVMFAIIGIKLLYSAIQGQSATKPAQGRHTAPGKPQAGNTIPQRRAQNMLPQRWRDWVARAALLTQVSRLLGHRQSAYLRKMLEMFDKGDLDDALRHAIPLGGDGVSLGQAFGTPSARNSLTLSGARGERASISLGDDVHQHLRKLYRQSFERLDRAGRIDEAVFVLAELLAARKEALDYLEKHQRLKQAAELALAWDMPSDQIVRLHCLAGEWRTALAVARRDNAYANAVTQLGEKWPEAAKRLRRDWAESLASQGAWLEAVEVIWPIEDDRSLATSWLQSAEGAGGYLGARALVRRAALLPDTMLVHAERLRQLRDDPAANIERNAIAESLVAQRLESPAIRRMAMMMIGPVLQDQARGLGSLDRKALQSLLNKVGDPLLHADLPGTALPTLPGKALSALTETRRIDAPPSGVRAVLDAVPLDSGRYLLAVGEAGALVVDRFGKTLSRFAVPSERLVIASSGQVALALAQRDGIWRISRLDLANRKIVDLGMLALSHFATEFDGVAWTVAVDKRLCVLDTTRSLYEVLWQVSDLPGRILALTRSERLEQVIVEDGDQIALWRYQLPQRRLQSRDLVPAQSDSAQFRLLVPEGGYQEGWLGKNNSGKDTLFLRQYTHATEVPLREGMLESVNAVACFSGGNFTVVKLTTNDALSWWQLVHSHGRRVNAEICWPAVQHVNLRMTGKNCLLFDEAGRVLHLDTETSQVVAFGVK